MAYAKTAPHLIIAERAGKRMPQEDARVAKRSTRTQHARREATLKRETRGVRAA